MTLPRIALVLPAVFAFACAPRAPDPPGPAPAPGALAVEDSVWAAVLDSLYVHRTTRLLVVDGITSDRFRRDRLVADAVRAFSAIPGVEPYTVESFWARNLEVRSITSLPRTRVPLVLVSEAAIDSLPDGIDSVRSGEPMLFWRAFHERYPGSSGLITLTRPGFNAARTQAILNVDRGCGGLCGDGTIILLARDAAGRWRVVHTRGTWVS